MLSDEWTVRRRRDVLKHSPPHHRLALPLAGLLAVIAAVASCGGGAGAPSGSPPVVAGDPPLPPMVLQAEPALRDEAPETAALPSLPPPPKPLPAPPPEEHRITVRTGETLGLYERWSALSEDDLKEQNNLRRARGLRVGNSFTLTMTPEQAVQFSRMRREFHRRREEAFFRTHEVTRLMAYVVRPGDTLRAISRRYSEVPRWLMEKVNQGHDLSHLRPGDIINLPVVREASPASQREAEARAAAVPDGESAGGEGGYQLPRPRGALQFERPPLGDGAAPPPRRRAWADADDSDEVGRPASAAGQGDRAGADDAWFSDAAGDGPLPPATVDVRVKVRKGECIALYAQWSGVSTDRIVRTNDLLDPSRLRVGQELRIPLPEPDVGEFYERRRAHHNGGAPAAAAAQPSAVPAGGSFVYTVRQGDSAWKIAVKRFGLSLQDLQVLNPTVNLDRLRVGDTLLIPNSAVR